MNENIHNDGSGQNLEADALLSRMAAADPAAGFDASTLSSTLVDDAVASAATKPTPNFARRQASRLSDKLAQAYRERPRYVLGSAVSGLASVAAIAIVGSITFGGLGGGQNALFTVAGMQTGLGAAQSDSKIAANAIVGGGEMGVMMPAFSYNYLAGSSLSSDNGSEHIYSLEPLEDPAGFLQNLADYLGITQKVHKGIYADFTTALDETKPYDLNPGKPQLTLSTDGGGGWWLEIPYLNIYGCPLTSDVGKEEPQSCQIAASTKPTVDDAKTQFIKLFSETGFSFEESDIQVSKNDVGITEAFAQTTQGKRFDNLGFGMTWNSDGELVAANGLASKLVDKGTFKTVSEVDAVARANEPKWQRFGYALGYSIAAGAPVAGYGSLEGGLNGSTNSSSDPAPIAIAAEAPSPTAAPSPTDAPKTNSTSSPGTVVQPELQSTAEPIPGDSGATADPMPAPNETTAAPTPEVKDVVIDRVELSWIQITDAKGKVWLVPAYHLFSGANAYQTVPVIADGLIEF